MDGRVLWGEYISMSSGQNEWLIVCTWHITAVGGLEVGAWRSSRGGSRGRRGFNGHLKWRQLHSKLMCLLGLEGKHVGREDCVDIRKGERLVGVKGGSPYLEEKMLAQKMLVEVLVEEVLVEEEVLVQTLALAQEIVAAAPVQKRPCVVAFLHLEVAHPWLNSGYRPL